MYLNRTWFLQAPEGGVPPGGTGDPAPAPAGGAPAGGAAPAGTGAPAPTSISGGDGTGAPAAGGTPAPSGAGGTTTPPEKYTLQLPENFKQLGNGPLLSRVEALAKSAGLSQEAAQAELVKHAEVVNAALEYQQQQSVAQLQQLSTGWAEAVKSDPVLGGANFDTTATNARLAVNTFGSPELKQLLNETGYGNHPEFVRFCNKIGKLLREDSSVMARAGVGGGPKDPAKLLYPNNA